MHCSVQSETAIINQIMRDFTTITDMASVYVDIRGKVLSTKYSFTNFCNYMRSRPHTAKLCAYCDAYGGLESSRCGQFKPYRCHAGLSDFSIPIIASGQLKGYILAGQTIVMDSSLPQIAPATDWHSSSELKSYYRKLPSFRREEMESAVHVLKLMAMHYFPEVAMGFGHLPDYLTQYTAPKEIALRPEIKRALAYIDKHLYQNPSLRDISAYVYLSETYFSKLFKKEMGLTLVQYVNQRKLDQAKILLRESDTPIESIAKALGFSRPSYFSKIFKEAMADTPHGYRKKYRA